jgi:hypothetical protein
MNDELWDDNRCYFVDRSRLKLGLANPWAHNSKTRHYIHYVRTKEEALSCYRSWLNASIDLICNGLSYLHFDHQWEVAYIAGMMRLASKMRGGDIDILGNWDFECRDYIPVPDGLERSHAEILYKGSLRLVEHFNKLDLLTGMQ